MQKALLTAFFLLAGAGNAWACAVCGFGQDDSTMAFLQGTALLSLMPLGMIGGLLFYIYKRTHGAPKDDDVIILPTGLEKS